MTWEEAAQKIFPEEWKAYLIDLKKSGMGRRPDSVEFTSIDHDVKRRDLTVNALFYDIQKKEVVDLVGGREDLHKGMVRTVGSPKDRFEEDPLRKLRAVRFCFKLKDGVLSKETHDALKSHPSLDGISAERIRDEFLKILHTADEKGELQMAINMLQDLGFFRWIFPGLKVTTDEDPVNGNIVATLATLLYTNDPNAVAKQLNKLTYSTEEVSAVKFLLQLQSLTPENAYVLKKLQERSSLKNDSETVLQFAETCLPLELAKTFAEYRVTTDGSELEAKGFTGQDLGKEMQRIETEKFKALLK
jgi:tRNA nucleotidyltransferase/poly(A) polymerase